MRKRTDLGNYYMAADTLRRNGIGMLATFVAGFDGDSYEDVVNIAEFGEQIGLFTVQVYARSITPGTVDSLLSENRILPGALHKYRNGHGVYLFPTLMLPSDLQFAIFDAAFRFHAGKDRKPAQRAFRTIWAGLAPHYEGLLRLEKEILIPEGIYEPSGSRFLLNERALNSLAEDRERYDDFARRSASIFQEADRKGPSRKIRHEAARAIA
jgi:radical SAM superfamily enzyme YgiQ (UPF0313 family)